MADVKISDLPAASTVADADITPIVQGGTTKKSAFSVIKTYLAEVFAPLTRALTIGGTSQTLAADRSWTTTAILDGLGTEAQGDILYRGASAWAYLSASTDGNVLTTHGAAANPTWTTPTAGAPTGAHYLTNQAESGLSAEINLGALATGLLKGTVSGSVSTISAVGDSTVGDALVTLTNPSAVTFIRINADNSVTARSASDFRGDIGAGTGSGTVTNTGGNLTSNAVVLGAGTVDAKVVAGVTTDGTSQITLGVNTTTLGKVKMFGNTSGDVTLQPAAVAGTATALTLPSSTDTLVGKATTDTLTNKRNTARITTITSSATPTINTDNCDAVTITALAAAINTMSTNLTGTPNNFDKLLFRIKDDGTARALAWGASFVAKGVALPTTTVLGKLLTVGFIYDSVATTWGCVASAQEV